MSVLLIATLFCGGRVDAAPRAVPSSRKALIGAILPYFREDVGVDPASGYPFDSLVPGNAPLPLTQPTAIGMRLELLGHIVAGDLNTSATGGPIRRYYAVDQSSSILGLIARQGRSLRAYADSAGWTRRFIELYRAHFRRWGRPLDEPPDRLTAALSRG